MNDKSVRVSSGISLSGLTFIVFLVLKLCGVIDWSWWWVTAPLWIPVVLFIATCVILFIGGIFIGIIIRIIFIF